MDAGGWAYAGYLLWLGAGCMDFLQHRRRRRKPQARTAIVLGDQHRQETRLGQGLHELFRIGAFAILRAPVFARELGAEPAHRLADFRKAFGHPRPLPFGLVRGLADAGEASQLHAASTGSSTSP